MGLFTTRARSVTGQHEAGVELPAGFAAVGEALASGPVTGALEACAAAGAGLARDGVPLEEALDGLHETWRRVLRREPTYAALRALGSGWSEETLAYLHQLGCEDPLSGLASLAHLRSRLGELYRDHDAERHALLVLDVPDPHPGGSVDAALLVARLAETARTAFPGGRTMARVVGERVAVLVPRDDRLPRRLGVVRALVATLEPPVRVWTESLPATDALAARLLDELARR